MEVIKRFQTCYRRGVLQFLRLWDLSKDAKFPLLVNSGKLTCFLTVEVTGELLHYFWVTLDRSRPAPLPARGKASFGNPLVVRRGASPASALGSGTAAPTRQEAAASDSPAVPDLNVPQQSKCEKCRGESTSSQTPNGRAGCSCCL